MSLNKDYGLLLNSSTLLHRNYFNEMVKLIGIKVIYRAPRQDKHYTTYAEVESNYEDPIVTYCIFEEHPNQKTLKKIGWVSELQENSSFIYVSYDLPGLQRDCLFVVPSGLDNGKGRLFRVISLANSIVYPSAMICEIAPEYEDTLVKTVIEDYSESSFNLLNQEPDDMFEYTEIGEKGEIIL